jgi:hypothetical protein
MLIILKQGTEFNFSLENDPQIIYLQDVGDLSIFMQSLESHMLKIHEKIMSKLDQDVQTMLNIPESHQISTIEDNISSQEAANAISESTSKLRKRKVGRQEKILADLYLLSGFVT